MQRQIAPAAAAARHPFRNRVVLDRADRLRRADESDWKLFALSFTAFFVCFYTFIS